MQNLENCGIHPLSSRANALINIPYTPYTLALQTKTFAIETFHMEVFGALQVVLSVKLLILQDLSHSPARLQEILEERLKPIHDFKTQEPKDVEVNVWMTSMANLLQILRSLSLTQHLF